MFRTRDFVLLFVTVVFLLVGIGTTLWKQHVNSTPVASTIQLAQVSDQDYPAEIYTPETGSRVERLEAMRQKIAESNDIPLTTPETLLEETTEPQVSATETKPVITAPASGPQQCPGYQSYAGVWPASGVQIEEREGARIVYRELATADPNTQNTATSAVSTAPAIQQEVLLQLPMSSFVASTPTCLSTDVVGVAKDGSLIRNNEASLYGVFGADTLVGYALDGFPIYGTSNVQTDNCGGAMVAGQYRYYLSSQREVVLNCFSGIPAAL